MFANIDLMVCASGPRELLREEEAGLFALWTTPDSAFPERWLVCLELAEGPDDTLESAFTALVRASAVLRARPGIVVHDVLHDIGYRVTRASKQIHEMLPDALLREVVSNGDRIGFSIYPEEPEDV